MLPHPGDSVLISAQYECVYGEFVPLYSCLHPLREQYRSQHCDIAGTTTTH